MAIMSIADQRRSTVFVFLAFAGATALLAIGREAAREHSSISDRAIGFAVATIVPLMVFGIIGAFHQLRVGTAARWLQRSGVRLVILGLASSSSRCSYSRCGATGQPWPSLRGPPSQHSRRSSRAGGCSTRCLRPRQP
jgi:hypothetical protein